MENRDSLSRLTEREKACLRQWLNHKSAKEIAADFGISHHAVEKRLKMARTKLGATSSLEAARMLGAAEGYGQTVTRSPDLDSDIRPRHPGLTRSTIFGVTIMILIGAVVLALTLQPATFSQGANNQPAVLTERASVRGTTPTAGTEAALRTLVAGLARGAPDYGKLSPPFAGIVRRDLPRTQPLFSSMGELKSVTFRGRGDMADDIYDLVFANGTVKMSAALDEDGRMVGGILQPLGTNEERNPGTEAVLRMLVAGLAKGAPDYGKLSPPFAEIVRRDLARTQPLFESMGELKSITFRGRGEMGDDVYDLVFANGTVKMSAAVDADGRMVGGILQPVPAARR